MRRRTASTSPLVCLFFFNDTATTEIYTLSLHDALPISPRPCPRDRPELAAGGGGGAASSAAGRWRDHQPRRLCPPHRLPHRSRQPGLCRIYARTVRLAGAVGRY